MAEEVRRARGREFQIVGARGITRYKMVGETEEVKNYFGVSSHGETSKSIPLKGDIP